MRRSFTVLLVAAVLLFGLGATLLLWRPGPWPEPVDTGEWRLVREERLAPRGRQDWQMILGVGEDGAVESVDSLTLQTLEGGGPAVRFVVDEDGAVVPARSEMLQCLEGEPGIGELVLPDSGGRPRLLLSGNWFHYAPDEPRVPWVQESGIPLSPVRAVELPETRYRAAVVRAIPDGHVVWKRDVGRVSSAAMSEDGRRLFLELWEGARHVYDLPTDRLLLDVEDGPGPESVHFTPDGRRLLVWHCSPFEERWWGEVWDLDTGEVILSTELGYPTIVYGFGGYPAIRDAFRGRGIGRADDGFVGFDRRGRLIALVGSIASGGSGLSERVFLIDVATGETRQVHALLCDPRGSRLAVLDREAGEIRVARPGPALGEPIPVPGRARATRAARGTRWLALRVERRPEPNPLQKLLGLRSEKIHGVVLVDLEAERVVLAVSAESTPFFAFSPSGRVFAVLEREGRLRVWRREGGE